MHEDERVADAGLSRRDFLRSSAVGATLALAGVDAQALSAEMPRATAARMAAVAGAAPTIRIGFVGVGGQGTSHVENLVAVPGAQITAICDIRPAHAERARKIVTDKGFVEPRLYTRGERDFERLCAEEELDIVFNATPWQWHVPIALAAMKHGKHAASEVPFAMTLDDCWALVETAEKEKKHCVMMENCNYDRLEMLSFHLVRKGLLGEVLHGECGYLHDLRAIKFADEGEGLWRREWSKTHNGNLYPTHGLGPVANCMDINRGDRFESLVSLSSASRGLQLYAAEHYPASDPKRSETFRLGDVNSSVIRTANGRTLSSAIAPTCLARTAGCTWCRARAAWYRAGRIACISRAAAPGPTSGMMPRSGTRSTTIRCGAAFVSGRMSLPAMAAWIISRTTG